VNWQSRHYGNIVKKSPILVIMAMLLLVGCTRLDTRSTPTPTCDRPGATGMDKVLFPENGENHVITVHLPPCYAEFSGSAYPVLYWTNGGTWQYLFDTADRLMGQGLVPPFIIVMIDIDPNKGYGADAQIVDHVVPYIDTHYRTQPDRLQRSITGISHGAAIAVRSAFRAPNILGRVAVLSGGIAEGEQEKFTNWILAMPTDQRPAVLIDVGDQDGIIVLTHHLTALLDKLHYAYTFTHAPGNHETQYWESHMEETLKWLMLAH
jgi:enterochelin esterase-like enzyme